MLHELSVPGVIFVLLGLVAMAKKWKKSACWSDFPVPFLVFHRDAPDPLVPVDRPLSPFTAVIAACGFAFAAAWMRIRVTPPWRIVAFFMLFGSLIIPMARLDYFEGVMSHNKDTRTLAREWILKHVPGAAACWWRNTRASFLRGITTILSLTERGSGPRRPGSIREATYRPPTFHAGSLRDVSQIVNPKSIISFSETGSTIS